MQVCPSPGFSHAVTCPWSRASTDPTSVGGPLHRRVGGSYSYQWVLVIEQPPLLGIQDKPPFLERFFLLQKREAHSRVSQSGGGGTAGVWGAGGGSGRREVREPAWAGQRELASPLALQSPQCASRRLCPPPHPLPAVPCASGCYCG